VAALLAATPGVAGCGGGGSTETSTSVPTTSTSYTGPPLMPWAQAKKVIAPIVARLKQAGYATSVNRDSPGVGWAARRAPYFNGALIVYKDSGAARKAGSEGNTPDGLYAVIGTHVWRTLKGTNEGVSDISARFRQLVGAAEGCGSKCTFSASSF
jgi:hypothetical protein